MQPTEILLYVCKYICINILLRIDATSCMVWLQSCITFRFLFFSFGFLCLQPATCNQIREKPRLARLSGGCNRCNWLQSCIYKDYFFKTFPTAWWLIPKYLPISTCLNPAEYSCLIFSSRVFPLSDCSTDWMSRRRSVDENTPVAVLTK